MSWISKNFEKAALALALIVAFGISYLGLAKFQSVETDFGIDLVGNGNNQTAVANAELIPKALQSMKIDRSWNQALDGERPVDLFTGIALFVKSSEPEKSVDLLKDAPVHQGIPNTWWIENRLDPGFADSPNRDPDEDGFTNTEEFDAKTNPNNGKSHPLLLGKLLFVKDDSLAWLLSPGYGSENKFPFSYEDSKQQRNKVPADQMVAPNEFFFLKGPMTKRFKLIGHEVIKELNKKINYEQEVTIVTIEDQRPNKLGKIYKIPSPLPQDRRNEHFQFDRSAVFSLEALGLNGKEFKVEENTTFALPPDSPNKDFLLKSVTPNAVIVEYPDSQGGRKTIQFNRSAMPRLNN